MHIWGFRCHIILVMYIHTYKHTYIQRNLPKPRPWEWTSLSAAYQACSPRRPKWMYVCMYVCMYVRKYLRVTDCMYCMHVCMYVSDVFTTTTLATRCCLFSATFSAMRASISRSCPRIASSDEPAAVPWSLPCMYVCMYVCMWLYYVRMMRSDITWCMVSGQVCMWMYVCTDACECMCVYVCISMAFSFV